MENETELTAEENEAIGWLIPQRKRSHEGERSGEDMRDEEKKLSSKRLKSQEPVQGEEEPRAQLTQEEKVFHHL
jgi:hypothetical protein